MLINQRTGDTPTVSSVYQLPNEELFDEASRPSDEEREKLKSAIRGEIERLMEKNRW